MGCPAGGRDRREPRIHGRANGAGRHGRGPARAADETFALTEANAHTIAAPCTRLDGLPPAIELAAARIRLLEPGALLGRLSIGLRLLANGARDAPARPQTLREAIAWSYELLSPAERRLFEQLSVFAGGWTLEAVEEVCVGVGSEAGSALDVLGHLVAKSLVQVQPGLDGSYRYRLLETIRQYAAERCAANGQATTVAERFVAFASGSPSGRTRA